MRVGIIGLGVVGGALTNWLQAFTHARLSMFDPDRGHYDDVSLCQVVFICVPVSTVAHQYGDHRLIQNLSAVEEGISRCSDTASIYIRSTVLPHTCDGLSSFYRKRIFAMPEFLTERQAHKDMRELPLIVGDPNPPDFFKELFPGKKIIGMTNFEAELAKYTHNCFAAVKVNFFNTIYHLCQQHHGDYAKVLEGAFITGFIEPTHTQVPGPDGFLGFGGKCLPKDLEAFTHYLASRQYDGPKSSVEVFKDIVDANLNFRTSMWKAIQQG